MSLLLAATANEPIEAHTDTFLALRLLMGLITDKGWTVSLNRSGVVARSVKLRARQMSSTPSIATAGAESSAGVSGSMISGRTGQQGLLPVRR